MAHNSPVTTEKGVTSDPVPEVVGMHTMEVLHASMGSLPPFFPCPTPTPTPCLAVDQTHQ